MLTAKRLCWLLWLGCCLLLHPAQAQARTPDSILAAMTLEQKVAQMFMVTFYGRPMNEPARALISTWQPGAIALFPSNLGNPEQVAALTDDLQETLLAAGGIPAFIGVDQEGGVIAHLEDGFTTFPVPMLLTATHNPDLAYKVGAGMAAEMRAVGINMNFAPVADLNTNPNNPIIGRRSFGTDAQQVRPIVAAFVRGMQAAGVMATAKHFPGHGDTDADSHVTLPIVPHGIERLMLTELSPFLATMDAGVGTIMVAHIWYPALEPQPNLPASLSYNIVTQLLREQMGYDGLTMTDAMDMDAIDTVYSPEEAALLAIQAGHDFIVLGAHVAPDVHARTMQAIVDAVRNGQLSEDRINVSVQRILAAKERFGVLDWQPANPNELTALREKNTALIAEVFQQGVTIVYDNANLIPVSGTTAVIYPASQPALWAECNRRDTLIPKGVTASPTNQDIAGAAWAAREADTIIVFTQNADTDPQQQALVAALPPEKTIVVALQSPYDIQTLPAVGAYLVTYSPLKPAFAAACSVLFGDVAAQGQLSIHLAD
jgi:beta-N-acetylhexosaminidase